MNILVTNDDGIYSKGIYELCNAIKDIARVYVVAPDSEKSAVGHAITMHNPLKIKKINFHGIDSIDAYAVSGTPADCVKLGIEALLRDIEIDLVLSGINNGSNLGSDVIYSGTVSAALEAYMLDKSSIAISYDANGDSSHEYKIAANYMADFIKGNYMENDDLQSSVLNINFPNMHGRDPLGYRSTRLGIRRYENSFEERKDPRGNIYYWMGGSIKKMHQEPDSDISAIEEGYISITPLQFDLTNYDKLKGMSKL
ncbi:5'-nucleotidase SurE [Peptoclostridium acidaminophilum DSM 3953]|uniref:5'-nucleotidase SurE n=1 Tax=Peptoclostridium acidaminophilum DSM 3953 TaxID=1286171 RepID=W8T477_PEPAC|nr:5'/3'-nucleotidase SurE [Peptoclostridium acidaminophilum]AHM56559.1 5'-nucleotidase SurE [Peptoclostridium acidaminophilum DSM 3953]